MGCDSQFTMNSNKIVSVDKENYKVWHPDDKPELIIGSVGSVREINLTKYQSDLFDEVDLLKDNINANKIATKTVKKIFKNLVDHGVLKDEKPYNMTNSYLIAYKDKIFLLGNDGSVIKINDSVAIGSGGYEAKGSLKEGGKDPDKSIELAIRAAIENDIHCDFPIIITNTNSNKFKVIIK